MNPPLAYITGASSGIGEALAERYLRAGWRVALVARRGEQLLAWVDARGLDASRARIYVADVRDTAATVRAGAECIAQFGLPDVVIANAGISVGMDTADIEDLEVMRATFETNNVGMAATFHPFLEPMRRRGGGKLVGIASVAGIRGLPGHGAYCASKAAAIAYCESLRGECRGSGVQVVTILPGYIDTPLTRGNRYPMPFLMPAAAFADRAFAAIEAGASYRVIPWQMGLVAKLLRLLPNAWFDSAFAGRGRKRRRHEQAPGR
jgi:NAD(P)-dependent dehydrogenase (short-subunit alcohol dehydrogenase family)